MSTYIMLADFTDQGIRDIKDSPKRADAARDLAGACGAEMKDIYLTLGGQLQTKIVISLKKILTSQDIKIGVGQQGFQKIAGGLGQVGGHDHAGNRLDLFWTKSKPRQNLADKVDTHRFMII